MKANVEAQFEEIAENAIASAEAVTCPYGDFVEGLELIVSELRDRLELAKRDGE